MSNYRLIAVDMDGTLLKSDKTVDPETILDIQRAADHGIQVAFCSGRGIPELGSYLDTLSVMRYAVCMSGALVYDLHLKNVIGGSSIPQKTVLEIEKTAEHFDAMLHLMTEYESIARADQAADMDTYLMGIYQTMFQKVARKTANMHKEVLQHTAIPKVNIFFRSPEDRQKGYEELKHLPLQFAFAEQASLEMNAEGVSKAAGVKMLAAHLGIPMTEVMGIGDSDNDRLMLESVGMPVAMANAEPSVKAVCRIITEDNDHNGVGLAIRRAMQ